MRLTLILLIVAALFNPSPAFAVYAASQSSEEEPTEVQPKQKPDYRPMPIHIDVSAPDGGPPEPYQRELNSVERAELLQLELDFQYGKITQTEYSIRKQQLERRTYIRPSGQSTTGVIEW